MRKKITPFKILVFAGALLIFSCRKQINEPPADVSKESAADLQSESLRDRSDDNCQAVYMTWDDGFYHFHYNNKGLADQWTMDYGDNQPDKFTMEYDRHNKLSKAKAFFTSSNSSYSISFIYDGDRIIKERWRDNTTNTVSETVNTYNRKGQMIRRDNAVNDIHVRLFYNDQGNNNKVDYYQGDDLVFRGIFTFNIPNRNPYLAVSGVTYGFPYYTLGLWDQRWETSDKIILYDEEGNEDVIADYDPAKTRMRTGTHDYLTSVTYYDRVTATTLNNTFTYQNCGRNHGGGHDDDYDHKILSTSPSSSSNTIHKLKRILAIPSKDMKARLMELRKKIQPLKAIKN